MIKLFFYVWYKKFFNIILMFNEQQISLWIWENFELPENKYVIYDIIIDRKSKYTLVVFKIHDKQEISWILKDLKKDPYFAKATHNSYAWRILQKNGSILEWKNDDGETWAGMCILREIQRENWVNILIIVTRYFWWIKLESDRFKNVIQACKIFFEKIKK